MAIAEEKTYFLPEIGPLLAVPEFVSYSAISGWRNVGLTGDLRSVEASGHVAINENLKYVDWQGRPWTTPDDEGVWHDLCGLHLYSPGQTPDDEPTYSGYDIIWQFHVYQVSKRDGKIVFYNIDQRVVVRSEEGVISQTLGINRNNFGWDGAATKNLSVGFTGIDTTYENKNFMGFGLAANWEYSDSPFQRQTGSAIFAINKTWFSDNQYIIKEEKTNDPNAGDPGGHSGTGGGDGNHSRNTEAVTLPDLPALGALDAGMITLYRLTGPEMSSFTSELWTFWSAVKAFFADPLDFVIGCMIVPFTPSSTRQAKPKFGADVWNTAFDVISEQFYSISCGTIDIEKYYGSCFDYDPYRKLEIYIPYVGYRELPVDQVMGKTIELTYHIDCMSGDFVAFVHTPAVGPTGPQLTQIICQFAGTMGVHVPLSRESFDSMISAGINLLGGAVGMAAGGIAQAAGLEGGDLKANQIASQASSATVSAINSMKRNVIRSGSIGASSGMLAKQNPFIISTLPRQSLPKNYKDLEGYPSNIYGTVGSFPGYLAVETIKLNVTATSTEKEMIMQLLKGGVFV